MRIKSWNFKKTDIREDNTNKERVGGGGEKKSVR
jgi:hypothetical protein